MPIPRLILAVPVAITPANRIRFARANLLPGISIQTYTGRLAHDIEHRVKSFPEKPGFVPTHLVIVDQTTYLKALDSRLDIEGLIRPTTEHESVDIPGILRQVLISMTLVGRLKWQVGGYHKFYHSEPGFPFRSAGYSHAPTVHASILLRRSEPAVFWYNDVHHTSLRSTAVKLDRYYRTDIWWNDRLSVALGYLWSALTTTHPELSFVALCMALEAIATSKNTEITHILAERCALLARKTGPERQAAYAELKQLYDLRSKIVHGRSAPRKGPMTWETLAISAKYSMVPLTKVSSLLDYVIDVINSVLGNRALLNILYTKQSETNETKAIDEYFLRLLLS